MSSTNVCFNSETIKVRLLASTFIKLVPSSAVQFKQIKTPSLSLSPTHPHNTQKEHEIGDENETRGSLEYPIDVRFPHPRALNVQLKRREECIEIKVNNELQRTTTAQWATTLITHEVPFPVIRFMHFNGSVPVNATE